MSRKSVSVRRIVVNGNTFYWKADWRYPNFANRINHLRIWQIRSGWTLHILLQSKTFSDDYPTPKEVRLVIEYGLTHNWRPDEHGGDIWLTLKDALALERFEILESSSEAE